MVKLKRFIANPIISPVGNEWERDAVFNGCGVQDGNNVHLLYRALEKNKNIEGRAVDLSTIGYARSVDGVHFSNRKQLIWPLEDWEKFGCEDPRVTKIDDKFLIFYTAISDFPPNPDSIKVAVAITSDFQKIEERHLVTPFNAKAMSLFPEKINGKYAAILTVDTDKPPAKIAVAYFENLDDIWDGSYWKKWLRSLDKNILPSLRSLDDHVEIGAPPLKTADGWLLLFSYIKDYFTSDKIFSIEAALLNIDDPLKLIGRSTSALLIPEKDYETKGLIPDVVFPSGAIIKNDELGVYYGASDNYCCLATCNLEELLKTLRHLEYIGPKSLKTIAIFRKYSDNPIISPMPEHEWESRFTLNPAAIYDGSNVHILYRAQGSDNTSVIGYANSEDGVHIEYKSPEPVYVPREKFEQKIYEDNFSGCEDPRLTRIKDTIYMCYTAYDGVNPTRVAFTSISVEDFVKNNWNWSMPILISPPGVNDKNACIFSEKINGEYFFLHRLKNSIWIDNASDLEFKNKKWLEGKILFGPDEDNWDSEKIGIGPPPLKIDEGWLLIYHGLSKYDGRYRLGAALLDGKNPLNVLARLEYPILEPIENYEHEGLRPGTVFACGAVIKADQLFIYYGGADQYVCVASAKLDVLLKELEKNRTN